MTEDREQLAVSNAGDPSGVPAKECMALMDVLPDPLVILTLEGQLANANKACRQMIGLNSVEQLQKRLLGNEAPLRNPACGISHRLLT